MERLRLAVLAASLTVAAAAIVEVAPLPQAAFFDTLVLPMRGTVDVRTFPVHFTVDAGDMARAASSNICDDLEGAFDTGPFTGAPCRASLAEAVRAARGLAVQHEPGYRAAVHWLEGRLSGSGYTPKDWAYAAAQAPGAQRAAGSGFSTPSVWSRPYKARLLAEVASSLLQEVRHARARGAELAGVTTVLPNGELAPLGDAVRGLQRARRNMCLVGNGAGHASLLFLEAAAAAVGKAGGGASTTAALNSGGSDEPPLPLQVLAFDKSVARYAIPAQDLLDERYPDSLILALGDPIVSIPRFFEAYPALRCHAVVLDSHRDAPLDANLTAMYLRALAPFAAPAGWQEAGEPQSGHVVVLLDGRPSLAPGDILPQHSVQSASDNGPGTGWRQATSAGWLEWEATLNESAEAAGAPTGDALLYGTYAKDSAAAIARTPKLPCEARCDML